MNLNNLSIEEHKPDLLDYWLNYQVDLVHYWAEISIYSPVDSDLQMEALNQYELHDGRLDTMERILMGPY